MYVAIPMNAIRTLESGRRSLPGHPWGPPPVARRLERPSSTRSLHASRAFETDATRKRLRFHDLRSTGLTWMAIRGDDPLKIQQRAGTPRST